MPGVLPVMVYGIDYSQVPVQVRPFIAKETNEQASPCIQCNPCGNENQLLIGTDKYFTYDYVIGPEEDQNPLYDKAVAPLLDGFFSGYNSCILAYGQTASGKTHTMGSTDWTGVSETDWGVIPRVMDQVFRVKAEKEQDGNCEVTIRVSFLELYNEEFKDLLEHNQSNRKSIIIREDAIEEGGGTCVLGMREEIVHDFNGVSQWVQLGCSARTVGKTKMNEASSRSHAIFTVTMEQQRVIGMSNSSEEATSEFVSSKFHFVDLAGSERVKRTGAEGKRFEESVSINRSLFALGNVISALGDEKRRKEASHVPYRDSKLTRLLKDSLGGNSKTLMVACVSPADYNFEETLNTLQYANRARNIENKAVVNRDAKSAEVLMLRARVESLEKELLTLRGEGFSPLKRERQEPSTENMLEIDECHQEISALTDEVQALRVSNSNMQADKAKLQLTCDAMEQQLYEHGLTKVDGELFQDKFGEYLREIEANATVIESMNVELDAMRSLIQQTDDIESQDEHDESMTSDFDEIHETHFAEESVQYHARIDTLSEDIANNEKLTDFFVQKEAKYAQLQRQYEAELSTKKDELNAAVQEANKVKQELMSTTAHKERATELNKKNKDQEEKIGVLKKTIREQLKALKVRAAHTDRLNRLKEQNEKMKKEKCDLLRRQRENDKSHQSWRQERSRQIQQLQREKQKALQAAQSSKSKEMQKDAMLDRRKKMIEYKDKKLKEAERKLASAARNLVRSTGKRGKQSRSREQKMLDQQVERILNEKAVQSQLQKLQIQHEELLQRKNKIVNSLERAAESNIPSLMSKNRVAEEYEYQLECIEAELKFKDMQINEVASSAAQCAAEQNAVDIGSLSQEEASEVMSRFFGNLIESKEVEKRQVAKIRGLETVANSQKTEIHNLRKHQSKIQAFNETGVDASMARVLADGQKSEELHRSCNELKTELKNKTKEFDSQVAMLKHVTQEAQSYKARLEEASEKSCKLDFDLENQIQKYAQLQQDMKKQAVRAKMDDARSAIPDSVEAQLKKTQDQLEESWKEQLAATARADKAEQEANDIAARLKRRDAELNMLKGKKLNQQIPCAGQTA